MKQRKFRKQFWCWTFKGTGAFTNYSVFVRAHNRKVK